MFDPDSFSTESFETQSWLMDFVQTITRFVARLKSTITKAIRLNSEI